ncbi:hypothetical protein [Acinetobacter baumannii]|uniref:hypothetical protein n=1 Tax=Acinetobacter baumannii TaxID=470 RepID=UPI0011282CF8|nr:hypothetical protein [Acinetobacter baumannii]TPU95041.1 hypothetical protein FJV26_14235 [Acinetobacter baumannii]
MVKVVKRGKLPEEIIHEITCHNCKSDLEFKENEARISSYRNETNLVITCPVCKKELWKAK